MISIKNCKTKCKAVIYSTIEDFNVAENGVEIILPFEKEKFLETLGYVNLEGSGIYFIELTDVKCLSEVASTDGKEQG